MEVDVELESFTESAASGSLDININPRHDGVYFAPGEQSASQNREPTEARQRAEDTVDAGHVLNIPTTVPASVNRTTSNDIDSQGICVNGKVETLNVYNCCCRFHRDGRHEGGRTQPDSQTRRKSRGSGNTGPRPSLISMDTSRYGSQQDTLLTLLTSGQTTLRRRRGSENRLSRSCKQRTPPRPAGAADQETSLKRFAPTGKTFRLLLVGKTGAGKSSTGNTILGSEHFTTSFEQDSETPECQFGHACRDGNTLEVMDLPGLFDTNVSPNRVTAEMLRAMFCMNPGPHAVLYVVEIGRYAKTDFEAYNQLKSTLGEKVTNHMVIAFTHGDKLARKKMTIEQYLKKATKNFATVLEECGHRYVVFDNSDDNPEPHKQVEDLLWTVRKMTTDSGNDHYCSDLTTNIQKFMTAIVSDIICGDPNTDYTFAKFLKHVEELLDVPGLEVNREERLQMIRSMESDFNDIFASLRGAEDEEEHTKAGESNRNLDQGKIETNNATDTKEWLLEQLVKEKIRRKQAEEQCRQQNLGVEKEHADAEDEAEEMEGLFRRLLTLRVFRSIKDFFRAILHIIKAIRIFIRYAV